MTQQLNDLKDALAIASASSVAEITVNNNKFQLSCNELSNALGNVPLTIRYVSTDKLNVRKEAKLQPLNIIGSLGFNDKVTFTNMPAVVADNIEWHEIFFSNGKGWIADKYTATTVGNPPTKNSPVINKYGFNILIGSNDEYQEIFDMAQRLFNAGKPLASVVVLNNVFWANRFSEVVPIVVARFYIDSGSNSDKYPDYNNDYNSAFNAGYQWVTIHRDMFIGLKKSNYLLIGNNHDLLSIYNKVEHAIYLQVVNEPTYREFDYAMFYGMAKAYEAIGFKGVLFNDSVGRPEPEQMLQRSRQTVEGKAFFQWMLDSGHLYGLHLYGRYDAQAMRDIDEGDWSDVLNKTYYGGRFMELFDPLAVKPNVIITESGEFRAQFLGNDRFVKEMQDFNNDLAKVDYILAFNEWCLNDNNDAMWKRSRANSALPLFEHTALNS